MDQPSGDKGRQPYLHVHGAGEALEPRVHRFHHVTGKHPADVCHNVERVVGRDIGRVTGADSVCPVDEHGREDGHVPLGLDALQTQERRTRKH